MACYEQAWPSGSSPVADAVWLVDIVSAHGQGLVGPH